MIKYYDKIETLYNRDLQTKKLIPNSFRNATLEYLKDNQFNFTEKVDGTNIIVYWDGHKVSFHGRTANAQIPKHLLERLETLFGGQVNEEIFEQQFGEKEVELFGEGYGIKIQNGGLYRNDVDFIVFDVMINGNYQSRETVEEIAKYFNIDVVPTVFNGTLQQAIDYVKNNPNSIIAKNGAKMEGLVGRPLVELKDRTGNRVIVKIKYCDFKEF